MKIKPVRDLSNFDSVIVASLRMFVGSSARYVYNVMVAGLKLALLNLKIAGEVLFSSLKRNI